VFLLKKKNNQWCSSL